MGDRLEAFVQHAEVIFVRDDRIVAEWLDGSLAAGTADAYSDVDPRIAIAEHAYDAFVCEWQRLPERLSSNVMRQMMSSTARLRARSCHGRAP